MILTQNVLVCVGGVTQCDNEWAEQSPFARGKGTYTRTQTEFMNDVDYSRSIFIRALG